jgi:hypothetical protein
MQLVIGRDGRTAQSMADAIDPANETALKALNGSLVESKTGAVA